MLEKMLYETVSVKLRSRHSSILNFIGNEKIFEITDLYGYVIKLVRLKESH